MEMIFFYSMALLLFFFLVQQIKNTAIVIGLWIILCGIVGNQMVVIANKGRMPVFIDNISAENRIALQGSLRHQEGGDHTRLKILSDVVTIKRLERIVSIGDIAMTLALIVPLLGYIMRFRANRGRFLEKNVTLSYPIVFCAMIAGIIAMIAQYWIYKP
jgi:hypothetical protein